MSARFRVSHIATGHVFTHQQLLCGVFLRLGISIRHESLHQFTLVFLLVAICERGRQGCQLPLSCASSRQTIAGDEPLKTALICVLML